MCTENFINILAVDTMILGRITKIRNIQHIFKYLWLCALERRNDNQTQFWKEKKPIIEDFLCKLWMVDKNLKIN